MTGLTIKLKTKNGQHVVKTEENFTLGGLKTKITELTQIPSGSQNILIGFPPKLIECEDEHSLETAGIKNGDILIVEEKQLTAEEKAALENAARLKEDERLAQELALAHGADESSGILLKEVVPADNSCLFTSVGFVMTGRVDTESGSYMRQIIAETVHQDKDNYNPGVLGRDNDEYSAWIMQQDSWGGAIEVAILSKFYGVEFDVVDITSAVISRFGEDQNYGMRGFLLFDGIHYDPLYLEPFNGGARKTIFPIEDESVFSQAKQLAEEAKSSRQYTDVQKFTLKCTQCDCMLTGQTEAQAHAKSTGHTSFGEV